MKRLLKIFVVWVLVIALPAQAMATAMRISCGPDHHLNVSAPVAQAPHVHVDTTHDMDDAHQHHGLDAVVDVTHAATPDATLSFSDSSEGQHQYKSAYCSSCAACCVGASAPPSNAVWTDVYTASFVPFHSITSLFTGHVSAGLERPPKFILA